MSFLLEASDVFFNMKTLGLVSREIKASFVFLHKQQKALSIHLSFLKKYNSKNGLSRVDTIFPEDSPDIP